MSDSAETPTAAGATGTGEPIQPNPDTVLAFEHVTKIFGDRAVVDDVSFDVHGGSVVALLGENGAGKSTLIKMLAGVYKRDGGEILLNGVDVSKPGGRDGIAFIHQDLGLLEWMTIGENMGFGLGFPRTLGRIRWDQVNDAAAEAMARIGVELDPRTRVFDLSRAEKSLLAIARALAADCRILVLDEPTASLPEADVTRLFGVMDGLRSNGVGMIFVSHRLDEVFRIADQVVVMRDGRLVSDTPTAQTSTDKLVVDIVGKEPVAISTHSRHIDDEVVLRLDGFEIGDVGPVSFDVKAGEVVALVGLRGAGQAVVGRALSGLELPTGGQAELKGRSFAPQSPRHAIDQGVAFVTSNREAESMAPALTVRENLFINPGLRGRRWWHSRRVATERAAAYPIITKFGVRPLDTEREIATLSGGNQQKVILARWLDIGADLIVLEEPTMGVDVGAKADIYNLLNEALEEGTAVVIVSTDLEEVANASDRALVFSRGQIVAELRGDELTVAELITHSSATPASATPASTAPISAATTGEPA